MLPSTQRTVWVVIALFVLCALFVPRFASLGNLENVLRIAAILALAAAGQSIVLLVAGVDFSAGASVALVSVCIVSLLDSFSPGVAMALGAFAALAVGLFNAWLVGGCGVNPLIATLGSSLVVGGLASAITGGMPLDPTPPEGFYWLGRGHLAGIPVPIWLAVIGLLVLHVLLSLTTLGRKWALVGSNPVAARNAGIRVGWVLFSAYAIAGVFIAVAGAVLTSRVASGQPHLYPSLPFEAIAACALGGIALTGGRATALQVLLGVLMLAVLNNVLVLLNLPAALQQLAMGVVIAAAVVLQVGPGRLSRLRRLWPARLGGSA